MAPSFDCFSSLLCAEDNIIFDENDRGGLVEELEDTWEHPIYDRNHSQIQNLDVQYVSFPLPSEECLRLMMESELHHLPNGDYVSRLRSGDLDIGSRTEAIDWIEKVGFKSLFDFTCSLRILFSFSSNLDRGLWKSLLLLFDDLVLECFIWIWVSLIFCFRSSNRWIWVSWIFWLFLLGLFY